VQEVEAVVQVRLPGFEVTV